MRARSAVAVVLTVLPLLGASAAPTAGPAGEPQLDLRVSCSSEAVRQVITSHRDELLACYRQQLAKRPGFSSTSIYDWTVRADGSASPPSADSVAAETEDPALGACVQGRIAAWTFPRPAGGPVEVTLTAVFNVKRGSAAAISPASPAKVTLQKAISAHAAEIEQCYQARLAEDPKLQGKVVLRWMVEVDGKVRDVAAADGTTLQDHALLECMKARVAGWRFPSRNDGGVTFVTYPWVFQSRTTP